MKINEVVKQTGMSRRTIYYYIEEQFITPEINPDNGYYIFMEKEILILQVLQKLRKADFSIKDIHNILNHPASIHVCIFKHLEDLERKKAILNEQIQSLTAFEKTLPMVVTSDSLLPLLVNAKLKNDLPSSDFSVSESNVKLVSLFLWGPFIQGIEMTEYRQYLWKKLLDETATSMDSSLTLIRQYLYALPAEQIDNELAKRNLHIQEIINLTGETIGAFVKNLKKNMKTFIQDRDYINYWKSQYQKQICPQSCLFDSELNALVRELSPRFSTYYKNIHICCDQLYKWLTAEEDGVYVKELLLTSLNGYIDIEANHHAELAFFVNLPIHF